MKNFFPTCLVQFQIGFLRKKMSLFAAWKKLYKKKKIEYQALNVHSADKLNIACIFRYKVKNMGSVM